MTPATRARRRLTFRPYAVFAGALLWIALLLLLLKNPTSLDDGLRHMAMARHMAEHGILQAGWNDFFHHGTLSALTTDPWFLSDVLLMALLPLGAVTGLKVFVLLELSLIAGTLMLLISRASSLTSGTRSMLLLLLLFGNVQWLSRVLLARPYSLITACSLLVIWAVTDRRWILLAVIMTVSVLTSQLFVFPLAIGGAGALWHLLKRDWRAAGLTVGALSGGTLLGFTLHPQPLEYLAYLRDVFIRIPFQRDVILGTEMAPGTQNGALVAAVTLLGCCILLTALIVRRKNLQAVVQSPAGYLWMTAAGFFMLFLPWARSIDILWPVLLVLLAELIALKPPLLRELAGIVFPRAIVPHWRKIVLTLVVLQALALHAHFLLHDHQNSLSAFDTILQLPTGSRVLNVQWGDFPPLVSLRPDLSYARGVDPSFTYLDDPVAHDLSMQLLLPSDDTFPARVLEQLVKRIPSDYLALSDVNAEAIHAADTLPFLTRLPGSGAILLYRIRQPR